MPGGRRFRKTARGIVESGARVPHTDADRGGCARGPRTTVRAIGLRQDTLALSWIKGATDGHSDAHDLGACFHRHVSNRVGRQLDTGTPVVEAGALDIVPCVRPSPTAGSSAAGRSQDGHWRRVRGRTRVSAAPPVGEQVPVRDRRATIRRVDDDAGARTRRSDQTISPGLPGPSSWCGRGRVRGARTTGRSEPPWHR